MNRRSGRDAWRAINLNNLGICQSEQGHGQSVRLQRESLNLFSQLPESWHVWGRAMAQCDLGAALTLQGESQSAREALTESLRLRLTISNSKGIGASLRALGWHAQSTATSTVRRNS